MLFIKLLSWRWLRLINEPCTFSPLIKYKGLYLLYLFEDFLANLPLMLRLIKKKIRGRIPLKGIGILGKKKSFLLGKCTVVVPQLFHYACINLNWCKRYINSYQVNARLIIYDIIIWSRRWLSRVVSEWKVTSHPNDGQQTGNNTSVTGPTGGGSRQTGRDTSLSKRSKNQKGPHPSFFY